MQGLEVIGRHRDVQRQAAHSHRALEDAARVGGIPGQHRRVGEQVFEGDPFSVRQRVLQSHHEGERIVPDHLERQIRR